MPGTVTRTSADDDRSGTKASSSLRLNVQNPRFLLGEACSETEPPYAATASILETFSIVGSRLFNDNLHFFDTVSMEVVSLSKILHYPYYHNRE